MNTQSALDFVGIKVRARHGNHKVTCPKCSAGRKPENRKDPCLSVTISEDGPVWNCHNCGWTTPKFDRQTAESVEFYNILCGGNVAPEKPQPRKPGPIEGDMNDRAYQFFESRGISRETVDRNGIRLTQTWMPGADGVVNAVAFPYFRDGETVNCKYRDGRKHFRQEKGAEKVFYGLDTVSNHTTLAIVEGEMDALSLQEIGLHRQMGILSVPDGAPQNLKDDVPPRENDTKFEYIWNCWPVLERAEKVIIAVDNDAAGRNLQEELIRRIGREKCWVVSWPSINDAPRKDANEVLVNDGPIVLRECIDHAEPCPVSGLHGVDGFRDRVFFVHEHGRSRGLSTGWKEVDKCFTAVPGQFTVVTGTPGSGKSEFVDALCINLAMNHGWRFAICSFENDPAEDHLPKLVEKHLGVPFWEGPTQRMDARELGSALDWVHDHFCFITANEEPPTIDWILEKARVAVSRFGIRGLVIDPYNEIESNRTPGMTETEYVSLVISKCKRFARKHGVHVWFVAHPAKMRRDDNGNYPVPSLYDISGSAHWVNKADVGISVWRNFDDSENPVEIHVKKVRFKWVGGVGLAKLDYDKVTGRYSDAREKLSYERIET